MAIGSQIDLRLSVGSGSLLAVSPHCFESVQQSVKKEILLLLNQLDVFCNLWPLECVCMLLSFLSTLQCTCGQICRTMLVILLKKGINAHMRLVTSKLRVSMAAGTMLRQGALSHLSSFFPHRTQFPSRWSEFHCSNPTASVTCNKWVVC